MRQRASVLIGVLWCVVLLSVIVVSVLHTVRLDLIVQKHHGDRIQAHYLALAGIEKAKALLWKDAQDRKSSRVHHNGLMYDSPMDFRDIPFGPGEFRVFRRGREDEGGSIVYGVSDEESRLNVNTASQEALAKIYGMTPDVVAAILDWRDADNTVTPGGAEADYYLSLPRPYVPRDGPFETIRELLMVRGVTRELLLGKDRNQNGFFERSGDNPNDSQALDEAGVLDAGWAGVMTVDSSVRNLNAAGETRVDVKSADEASLTGIPGLTTDIARAIVAYRNQNQFESVASLLEVTAPNQNDNRGGPPRNGRGRNGPANNGNGGNPGNNGNGGPTVISESLLMDIADGLMIGTEENQPGAININSASLTVLTCLPGVDQTLARAIISYRKSNGYFANLAFLLKVQGMTRDIFKQIAPLVTCRSETFRIMSEGRIKSSRVSQRIQAIVRLGADTIETVSYREDL